MADYPCCPLCGTTCPNRARPVAPLVLAVIAGVVIALFLAVVGLGVMDPVFGPIACVIVLLALSAFLWSRRGYVCPSCRHVFRRGQGP